MVVSLCHGTAQAAQLHRYFKAVTSTQRVNEMRQTSAAIRLFAERAIHFSRCDQNLRVRRAHPVHRAANVAVPDRHAVTNDHGFPCLLD